MPDKRVIMSSEAASARDEKASSLIPMLIAGLVLVAVGGVIVMVFV
jgi:flagellar basal body-associated protein FliL